ncbi:MULTISPECIES: DUF4258 domain-containing protein [Spirosoma]|uniref:DUF4258 domain-containing protein n=1 Tax=Spirosoma sordidisoli TaxID=2502893 RepID=A0A4Q2UIE0_9BACT|nr:MULTISPECIES: DUF4258 domain-containing protein [Spirosoma]RYC69197.1 DUF4258 domain-containing protein [Spirosoma sordidisoli]
MTDILYEVSNHAREQMEKRGIDDQTVQSILIRPDQIIDDESGGYGQKVYQSKIDFKEKGTYLVRVFVNTEKQPCVVKTVYKTSKLPKYYEGEI